MYYRSPGNLNPILPRSDFTPSVVADNFDERTVINDDLNMNGYFIYNLKNPEDDQDVPTKIQSVQQIIAVPSILNLNLINLSSGFYIE